MQEAQKREESNPLTLAEVLRQLLFFFDEEVLALTHYFCVGLTALRIACGGSTRRFHAAVSASERPGLGGHAAGSLPALLRVSEQLLSLHTPSIRIDFGDDDYRESGFMSLEQLVEFMEDCAVLQVGIFPFPCDE